MAILIQSSDNSIYKQIKKLQTKNGRTKAGQYIAEGKRAVCDAISNGADVAWIFWEEGYVPDFDTRNIKTYELSKKLFDSLKLTVTSQGIMAVINFNLPAVDDMDMSAYSKVVYLDSVQDPGNMGTIIRSCDALGADAIVISRGCVDIFNPKVVRSTMASIMNVPHFIDTDSTETIARFKSFGYTVFGTFPDGDALSCNVDYTDKTLLVMGNEANGICDDIAKMCDFKIKIPMLGRAESLNVATALTVMLYEIMRDNFAGKSKDRGDT